MNNPKDAPFAACTMLALYLTLTMAERPPYLTWKRVAALGVATTLAINVRPLGLVLIGFLAFVLTLRIGESLVVSHASIDRRTWQSLALKILVMAAIAVPAG